MKFLLNFNTPYYLIFFVTSKCNAKCEFCFNYQRSLENHKILSPNEIEKIAQNFKSLKIISFTGGEPFLRPDLEDIIQIFFKSGYAEYFNLHTNGYNPEKLKKIIETIIKNKNFKYFYFCLSFDGLFEEHDRIRGFPGLFEKNVECLSIISYYKKKDSRLEIMSGTVITPDNINKCRDVDSYISKKYDCDNSVNIQRNIDEKFKNVLLKEFIDYSKEKTNLRNFPFFSVKRSKNAIDRVLPELIEKHITTGNRSVRCVGGSNLLVMFENGEIRPCEFLQETFGNIREFDYDVNKVIQTPAALKIKRYIKEKKCCCPWENALPFNIIYSPEYYLKILLNLF